MFSPVLGILFGLMAVARPLNAQTSIAQNNLIQNGGLDSGSTDWNFSGGGQYWYPAGGNGEPTGLSYVSIGWSDGTDIYQNTGAVFQPGIDYVLTMSAAVAAGPVTGVRLYLQDSSKGYANVTNTSFNFSAGQSSFQTFSMYIQSNMVAGTVGDTMAVGGGLYENPNSQNGWLAIDWMQLAPARPYFTAQPQSTTGQVGAIATLSATAIGAVTNSTGPGSVIQYQWYRQSAATPVAGATNTTLFFSTLNTTNAGAYYVVATGPFGTSQSSNAMLTVVAAAPSQYAVALTNNQTLVNSFDGWGTSLCWWGSICGGFSNRNDYASLAFTTLGLNIIRYDIGGGENPSLPQEPFRVQMQGFEPTNGVWDWSADQNQRWMMRQAVALGANHIYAFANSPPWWMTVSGSVTGPTNGAMNNLQTNCENTFAVYLSTVVSNLTVLDGVKFDQVTPVNEPEGTWNVYDPGVVGEGCHMSAGQQNRVINDLHTNLVAAGLTTGVGAPEDVDEQDTINDINSYNAAGQAAVALITTHTYGANNPGGLQSLATSLGKPLWITEYGDADASGLTMARRIHDDLTQTGARGWNYWQMVDSASGWGFLYNPMDSYSDTNYTINGKFYVMWQFSHFIRPGCQLINAGDTNSLAAYDSTNHLLTIVAQNDTTNGFSVAYSLGLYGSTNNQAGCWRTSAYENGNSLPGVAISNQQLIAYLAPQSVTTLVVSNAHTKATLIYAAGPNGTISGTSPQTVNSGANGTAVTAVPYPGYSFAGWSDGSTANSRTDTNVAGNVTVTANFAAGPANISQNNLLPNGGFDNGGTDWSASAGGVYFYTTAVGAETDSILSIGWYAGADFWQNTGAAIQPDLDYVLTIRALVAASPVTGVQLTLADAAASDAPLTNESFTFPDQTETWRVFSLYVSSNTVRSAVGDSMGVAGSIVENPSTQYGWLWADWVQLAPAVPQFTAQPQGVTNYAGASATLYASAIGAVTNSAGPGSVITYQWYQGGNPVANATNATLYIPALISGNSGNYYVVATGPFGSNQSSNAPLGVLPAQPAQYSVAVSPNQTLVDSFDGWGTSLCWWANVCGGFSNRNDYASLAFTTLGLNIVRSNIGGGENPGIANTMSYRAQMQGFEPTNGVWNWNVDQNQRWMLRQAVALGANQVYAFANSPPWWMTVSGSVTGSTNGTSDNLQTGYETGFARYLSMVVSNLTILDGVRFNDVTPMNEPTGSWWVYGGAQEGCHMDSSQQNRVVNDLRTNLTICNLTTGIGASEDTDEQDTINSVNSYDAAGKASVTLVASHTYGANNPAGLQSLATSLGKPAWISEYGDGDATGLTMARRIHDDLTQSGVRAWTYWQVVDNAGGWGFLYNPLDGSGNTNYTINEKYYVMWQFSHFIRPGCQLINAGDTNSLAAYDSTNHLLTIVAQNDTTNALTVNYALSAFSSTGSTVACWRTSPEEITNSLPPVPVSSQQFTAYLAAQSVTTYVISNVYATRPVAWYALEGNGLDVSGNGNNALLVTNATYVPGKIGAYAAQFNGNTNSYMVIPRSISNSFTITCWVKTTDTAGTGQWWNGKGIVDGEVPGSANDFGLALVGNAAGFGIGNPDTTIISTNAINDGQWHHLAVAWDSLSGQMQLYVDGVWEAGTAGPTGTRNAPSSLRLGSIQAGYAGDFLAGAIDDVQLFGRVMSSAEVLNSMNHPPTLAVIPACSVEAGQTLLFTNAATDAAVPAETLTWSLLAAPAGATVSALNFTNGVLSWRPAMAQAPSTNSFYEVVKDNGTPQLCATQSVSVVVTLPPAPKLASPTWANHAFILQVSGDAGPDYILAVATNLAPPVVWTTLATNLSAAPPLTWTDAAAGSHPQRFYRVLLGP